MDPTPVSGHRRPPPVIVLGSLNMDLVVYAERLPNNGETVLGREFREVPGGKGLNQVVAAARAGARAVMVGAVGDDAYGALLLEVLAGERVNAAGVRVIAGAGTGVASICVDAAGRNRIVVVPGANALVTAEQLPAHGPGVLLASLEVPLPVVTEAFMQARRAGITTVLNPAPATELPRQLLETCDVIIPNEHEAAALTGEELTDQPGMERAARDLCSAGPGTVIVTLGERGALVFHAGQAVLLPPVAVDPVDTTAAGDAFCGVFSARLAAGERVGPAVAAANAAGALATTVPGAVPSLPQLSAIQGIADGAPEAKE